MKWIVIFAACCALGSSQTSHPAAATKQFISKAGAYTATVTATRTPIPVEDQERWWGAGWEDRSPYVVARLVIRHGAANVYVPITAQSGLADVRQVTLTPNKSGASLTIEGGDTGTHYFATLLVAGDRVVSRVIRLSEFRDEDYEQTTYHYIPDDGR